jgi:hypothetical protein
MTNLEKIKENFDIDDFIRWIIEAGRFILLDFKDKVISLDDPHPAVASLKSSWELYNKSKDRQTTDPRGCKKINSCRFKANLNICFICKQFNKNAKFDMYKLKELSSGDIKKEREQLNKRIGELQELDWELALEFTKILEKEKKEQEENNV